MDISVPELLIILAIVIVLFGANRLAGLGSAMGNSVREFRKAVRDDERPVATTPAEITPATTTTVTTVEKNGVVTEESVRR
ncbi:MAG: hypothetical protein NVS4B8_30390 [Herpetosiphon sp.]